MITVYLCGSIGTVNIEEHLSWRERVSGACDVANSDCAPTNLTFLVRDPLRYQNPASFTDGGLHDAKVPDSFFVAMDVADVRRADVLFIVFWKQARQSVGTFMEMGMAAGLGKPMILVTDDPQVADHPFVNRFVSIVCKSVDEGIAWLKKMA